MTPLSVRLFICSSLHLFDCSSVRPSVCPSVFSRVRLSFYTSLHPSVHPAVGLVFFKTVRLTAYWLLSCEQRVFLFSSKNQNHISIIETKNVNKMLAKSASIIFLLTLKHIRIIVFISRSNSITDSYKLTSTFPKVFKSFLNEKWKIIVPLQICKVKM